MPSNGIVTPRPASSVVVLRRGDPFDVLVVKRRGGGTFPDLMVFPGGSVDEDDRSWANGHPDGPQRVAALRELAEETGILALRDGVEAAGDEEAILDALRRQALAIDSLVMISRWVTPEVMPYRFDTWFYLLVCDDAPEVVLDERELIGHAWIRPDDALSKADSGEWKMILPTLTHLRWLSRRHSVEEAVEAARGADGRTLVIPRVAADGSIVPVHLPAEAP